MNFYPYSSAFILNDATYLAYGGNTATSTAPQRNACYWIAERTLSEDLETFLKPTIITGTYLYNTLDKFITLDHSYVSRVIQTDFIDSQEKVYWSQTGSENLYIALRDDARGLVDIHYLIYSYNALTFCTYPYKIRIVYEAGLPTGTSTSPDILLALSTYSQIILNEIIGYGNEAPGDIGVQEFYNQQYREVRVKLTNTAFGSSAKAQFIKKLIEKYRKKRFLQL